MGLFDIFRGGAAGASDVNTARSALRDAQAGDAGGDAITATIQRILSIGLDGRGLYKGAAATAQAALRASDGDVERAIDRLARSSVRVAAGGGLITSLGGFVTMPVAIPANLLEFYVTATRTAGAIAVLRGYDINDPTIRTAVLLTLVGSKATDVLSKAGLSLGVGGVAGLASRGLPAAARMVIQKAVGFRLLKMLGEKTLSRFGRAVPLLGGAIGAVVDGAMMSRITAAARAEFPRFVPDARQDWGVR